MNTHRQARTHGAKLISGDQLAQFPEGRICDVVDCTTWLSRFNPAASCSRHRGWGLPVVPRRRAGLQPHGAPDGKS